MDFFIRRIFALKLGTLPVSAVAMATTLEDALVMVAATWDLGLFSDDGKELQLLLSRLREIDVESCEDFRLAFVTDDEVDDDMVKSFGTGAMLPYRELLFELAEEVIPDGAFYTFSIFDTRVEKEIVSLSYCGRSSCV